MKKSSSSVSFRVLIALLFVAAGLAHFIKPGFYLSIVPRFLPHPLGLVYVSGAFEILGGLGLLVPALRRLAGLGLILLLIAVFPANVEMLFQEYNNEGFSLSTFLLILRLPLQFVFISVTNHVRKSA